MAMLTIAILIELVSITNKKKILRMPRSLFGNLKNKKFTGTCDQKIYNFCEEERRFGTRTVPSSGRIKIQENLVGTEEGV